MPKCECLAGCPFFNDLMQDGLPGMVEHIKQRYCLTDNRDCARYLVFKALGKEKVPKDLFPIMVEEAKRIIAKKK